MKDDGKKLEPPFHLDMDFGEALARYGRTKVEEVDPAPGRKRKGVRSKPDTPASSTAEAKASVSDDDTGSDHPTPD